jgi:UDP-GlcNAc:undecaprenyl-phosphate GlcNAc-1-phosphate transferase
MYLFTTFILSLFLTIGLVPVFKRMAFRMNLVDEPDARKVHVLPMPRSGGISMAIGALVPVLIWTPIDPLVKAVLLGCAVIVVFGIVDDVMDLKYWQKLGAQVTGTLIVMVYGGVRITCLGDMFPGAMALPDWFSYALTLFFMVGVTNAINLSDGLDGLAGGVSMLSFVAIGFFAYQGGQLSLALMCIAVAGAILGFLRYNTHPAMVFMGDAGSQMLGFLCVVFTLILTQANTPYSQITPLFLIGFPIIDTLTVMTERMAKGNSPFKPDKNHFHHRLMKLGLYHSESVIAIYLLQAMFLCCAFLLRFYSNWLNLCVFMVLAAFIVFFFGLARHTGFKFRNGDDSVLGSKSILARFCGDKFSIKFFFAMLRWGLAFVFVFQCLIPATIPWYMSVAGAVSIVLILGVKRFKPESKKGVTRVCLYCSIPFLMYETTVNPGIWVTPNVTMINYGAFVGVILAVIGTLNLTNRRKGFKFNPLDFLIFIVIIVFPNLPSIHLETPELKVAVASALILFFSYDVLLGELRPENSFLDRSLVVAFSIMAIRGFI